jgi:hypothetical protein
MQVGFAGLILLSELGSCYAGQAWESESHFYVRNLSRVAGIGHSDAPAFFGQLQ